MGMHMDEELGFKISNISIWKSKRPITTLPGYFWKRGGGGNGARETGLRQIVGHQKRYFPRIWSTQVCRSSGLLLPWIYVKALHFCEQHIWIIQIGLVKSWDDPLPLKDIFGSWGIRISNLRDESSCSMNFAMHLAYVQIRGGALACFGACIRLRMVLPRSRKLNCWPNRTCCCLYFSLCWRKLPLLRYSQSRSFRCLETVLHEQLPWQERHWAWRVLQGVVDIGDREKRLLTLKQTSLC